MGWEWIEYLNSIFITDIRFLRMFSEQLCDTESKEGLGKHRKGISNRTHAQDDGESHCVYWWDSRTPELDREQ